MHTFPLHRQVSLQNESGTSRHTVKQIPENPSTQSQNETQSIQHQKQDLKSNISVGQKTVTADRQSGLLDKELRALASWYTPPAPEKGKDSIPHQIAEPESTTIIVDDLVKQDYELGINSDNTTEPENNTSLIGTADWLPISKFGIAISTVSLILISGKVQHKNALFSSLVVRVMGKL